MITGVAIHVGAHKDRSEQTVCAAQKIRSGSFLIGAMFDVVSDSSDCARIRNVGHCGD